MDAKGQIREFLRKNYYLPEAAQLTDEASLLSQGIIDSTGVLELIAFIERTFGITVLDTETIPGNLDSVDGIVAYVQRKQRRAPEGEAALEAVGAR